MSHNKTIALQSPKLPAPIGPYSQAVLANNFLFVSGTLPIDPESGAIITDIPQATKQIMAYISAILAQADMNINNIVKTTIYLTDMNDFAQVNEIYGSYFDKNSTLPARETVAVKALPKNAPLEISVIAAQ